jgi:hypothetical protein
MATVLLMGCTSQMAPSPAPAGSTSLARASSTSAPAPSATPALAESATPPLTPAASSVSTPQGHWKKTGSLHTARADFTATLLQNGQVLVAGGVDRNDESGKALASAEIYDPSSARWHAAAPMHYPRFGQTATLLTDGRVLVAGGTCVGLLQSGCPTTIDPSGAIAAAEIYDPKSDSWADTGSMASERSLHTATRLADGRVLVAGAELAPDEVVGTTELYDPATGRWTASGDMVTPRWQQFAVALPGGGALMAGGYGPITLPDRLLKSVEIFDRATRSWHVAPPLLRARAQGGTAILLGTGRILIAGGDGGGDHMLASAELYDPAGGSQATGAMSTTRAEHASVLLTDGHVLVMGGFDVPGTGPSGILTSAEIYDPIAGTWGKAGAMQVARFDLGAVVLKDGRVLAVGGLLDNAVSSAAELYSPAP